MKPVAMRLHSRPSLKAGARLYELLYELSCEAMRSLAHDETQRPLKFNNLAVRLRTASPLISAVNRPLWLAYDGPNLHNAELRASKASLRRTSAFILLQWV